MLNTLVRHPYILYHLAYRCKLYPDAQLLGLHPFAYRLWPNHHVPHSHVLHPSLDALAQSLALHSLALLLAL